MTDGIGAWLWTLFLCVVIVGGGALAVANGAAVPAVVACGAGLLLTVEAWRLFDLRRSRRHSDRSGHSDDERRDAEGE
jgi:hypothetical protein